MKRFADASFVILDAAKMGESFKVAVLRQKRHTCLYRGESARNLAEVAPYLFPIKASGDFGNWVVNAGWGQAWGVHLVTTASEEDLRLHLRKFLIIKTDQGKELYFRYYDPRVLRVILPTFSAQELREVFGPIQEWIVEDEDPAFLIRFRLIDSALGLFREPVLKGKQVA